VWHLLGYQLASGWGWDSRLQNSVPATALRMRWFQTDKCNGHHEPMALMRLSAAVPDTQETANYHVSYTWPWMQSGQVTAGWMYGWPRNIPTAHWKAISYPAVRPCEHLALDPEAVTWFIATPGVAVLQQPSCSPSAV
jgi:hypothetical protein